MRQVSGRDPAKVWTQLCGEYGQTFDGKPVYDQVWQNAWHVSRTPIPVYRGLPLWLGWDFGLTPACVVGQVSPLGQLRILREFVCERGGIKQFAGDVVKPRLATLFPGLEFWSIGDPAGSQAQQADSDLTCLGMLAEVGIPTIPAPTNLFDIRRQAVIDRLSRLAGADPAFLVDPSCQNLIAGFDGGYHYKRVQVSGTDRYHDAPDKNKYSHCIARGSLVSTTNGLVPIEDIRDGDEVLTRNGARKVLKSWMTQENAEVYRVEMSDGRSFYATSEHKVASGDLWIRVDELLYGQVLNSIHERRRDKWEDQASIQYRFLLENHHKGMLQIEAKVAGVSHCADRMDVFDLTVEGDHEFYVNGILVHNCHDSLQYLVLGVDRIGSDMKSFMGTRAVESGSGSVVRSGSGWGAFT
jgi:hypothetical protein